ncbi:Asp23/Gls24 family envelope stress response protein [Sphaerisporangium album]|uniref:Asp23/Gls24 family envelope stress response protein n=1 Tax=Sphaerisporangium album TaxID=509200 RepID=A0A367F652_9ACTN|nr:Asp23/Gls24 family envelope stress response protein [Sphaerisporangium album]RCG25342.1 Asp23/Gls24 family envelope stress response protein [Sphaerisporangium album]
MTTGAAAPFGARPHVGGPPEARGRTDIADRVLERVAAHAVAEVEHVGGVAPRVLGLPLGRDAHDTAPRVTAHAEGHVAIVRVAVSATYGEPVRQLARRVRDNVMARVHQLTGLEARQVDIEVTRFIQPPPHERHLR